MITKLCFSTSNRTTTTRRIALAAVVLVCISAWNARAASAPDWLSAARQSDIGRLGDGNPAVVVGEWTDFTVDANGKFVEIERRAIRVLNLRAAAPFLRATGVENTDESVLSIQGWAIPVSGRVIESQKKEIMTEAAYAQFELFSDDRVKILDVAGAEEGALVGYEVVRSGKLPLNGQVFMVDGRLPVRLGEVHVSIPSGALRWFINHPDRVQVVSQSPTAATFRVENRPGIVREDDMPPYTSLATAIFVNYDANGAGAIQSWEDAGKVIHPLLSAAEKPAPDIAAQVDALVTGQPNLLSKVDAVYSFVSRQVRYVAVEIGIGGFEPHPAADVFRNRYGDCKDKATLLLAMLDHLGLRGYPALVGTRGDIEADPKVPTLSTFDHMIVALPVSGDLEAAVQKFSSYDPNIHVLWIDPTSETAPLGQLPEMDQGVFALISYPDRGDLQRIPESLAQQNGIEYQTTLKLGADGNGVASVEEKYFGASNANRHLFYRDLSQEQLRQMFDERVARYANPATFQRASISGTEDNRSQIVESFSFAGGFASASTGDSWFFEPLFLAELSVPEVSTGPRKLPVELGTPYHVNGEYRIELPADMTVMGVPQPTSLVSEFGVLNVAYSLTGNVVVATESLSFTTSRIPADRYDAFRDFVDSVRRVGQVRLRVVKASGQ